MHTYSGREDYYYNSKTRLKDIVSININVEKLVNRIVSAKENEEEYYAREIYGDVIGIIAEMCGGGK